MFRCGKCVCVHVQRNCVRARVEKMSTNEEDTGVASEDHSEHSSRPRERPREQHRSPPGRYT